MALHAIHRDSGSLRPASLLSAILVAAPEYGTLQLRSSGAFDYIPEEGYTGSVTFTYRATDGFEETDPITVTIIVEEVEAIPLGTAPRALATGDFDGDTNQDVVVADGAWSPFAAGDKPVEALPKSKIFSDHGTFAPKKEVEKKMRVPTKCARHGFVLVMTADKLIVRGPLIAYVVGLGMYLLAMLALWIMIQIGLLNADSAWILPPLMAAGWFPMVILWGRWHTFDRRANTVRYFPWRLCALTSVRAVSVIQHRVYRKYSYEYFFALSLDLENGKQVRLPGQLSRLWSAEVGRDLAGPMAEWLRVPMHDRSLIPAA